MITSDVNHDVVNNPLWRTKFAIAIADEIKEEKYADHATTGRTKTWLDGWRSAWTQAYITICSVLDSDCYDRAMLLRWCDKSEASKWEADTPVIRRWKNRDTDRWESAVINRIDGGGWDYENSEFLRLD